jgi:hypothetical protein
MQISNENPPQNNAISRTSTPPSTEIKKKELEVTATKSNSAAKSELNLSSQGKLTQEIDEISSSIDDVLLKHVTPEQKEQLGNIYKALDTLFEKDNLMNKEEKSVNSLFEKAHAVLDSSVEKLTKTERENVAKLTNKMDELTTQLTNSIPEPENGTPSAQLEGGLNKTEFLGIQQRDSKKVLTVAQLNSLSVVELNKLPVTQLKKLNSQQLNKLNPSQLNNLALTQLKQLNASNIDKLNQSQAAKLSS